MKRGLTAAGVLLGSALGVLAGCETVDLGPPPNDINVCRPSQSYFVTEIWPNVLNKDYGGKRCADAKCHDPGSARPLTLIANPQPSNALDANGMLIVPFPEDWEKNYRSAANQMNCANASASDLILLPTNQRTHGGGQLFSPTAPEVTSLTMWVSAP